MLEKCWLIVNNSEKYNAEGKDTGKVALQKKWKELCMFWDWPSET